MNDYENFNNIQEINNTTIETEIIEENIVTLETIHNDLGFICSFLVIAAVVVFMTILYKFFNMFF